MQNFEFFCFALHLRASVQSRRDDFITLVSLHVNFLCPFIQLLLTKLFVGLIFSLGRVQIQVLKCASCLDNGAFVLIRNFINNNQTVACVVVVHFSGFFKVG